MAFGIPKEFVFLHFSSPFLSFSLSNNAATMEILNESSQVATTILTF